PECTLESIEKRFGLRPDPIHVIGGGAKGLPWLRITADISGRTLETVPYPGETAAVEAALLGAVGMGIYPSIEALKQGRGRPSHRCRTRIPWHPALQCR
ncbi:FGGY-family carbohydrate kinase, partial [Dehalococcoidia bacterium]|nr:FGGY-family carbohydrate kinase [Dehalococcoidia bacterium]